jgi:hypothetical protein
MLAYLTSLQSILTTGKDCMEGQYRVRVLVTIGHTKALGLSLTTPLSGRLVVL